MDVIVIPEDKALAVEPSGTPHLRPVPVPATPPLAAPAPSHLKFFAGTWVPLEPWCRLNGFGALRQTASGNTVVYSFVTTNGAFSVRMGSQLAYWNGLEVRLGFAPQIIDGQPFMHDLDLRKNFAPLVEGGARLKTRPVLVIDPGHGGKDAGTHNIFNGHYEKEFTLDWALRLQAILATNGWTVWLTRTNDVELTLPARVAIAAQHNADLFLSLHFNSSFPDREQAGCETYCLTPAGMPSNLTRGYRDDARLVFPNNNFDMENLQFAMQLHRAMLAVNGRGDRGVRHARFLGVLQNQNRPAVLVEGAYLSNPREARQIADPEHRQRLAEALARALLQSSGGGLSIATHAAAKPASPVPEAQRPHAE
jgi:N-acetylmuramoyl-L-alanine amidase